MGLADDLSAQGSGLRALQTKGSPYVPEKLTPLLHPPGNTAVGSCPRRMSLVREPGVSETAISRDGNRGGDGDSDRDGDGDGDRDGDEDGDRDGDGDHNRDGDEDSDRDGDGDGNRDGDGDRNRDGDEDGNRDGDRDGDGDGDGETPNLVRLRSMS